MRSALSSSLTLLLRPASNIVSLKWAFCLNEESSWEFERVLPCHDVLRSPPCHVTTCYIFSFYCAGAYEHTLNLFVHSVVLSIWDIPVWVLYINLPSTFLCTHLHCSLGSSVWDHFPSWILYLRTSYWLTWSHFVTFKKIFTFRTHRTPVSECLRYFDGATPSTDAPLPPPPPRSLAIYLNVTHLSVTFLW